jgi:hypothetical protein
METIDAAKMLQPTLEPVDPERMALQQRLRELEQRAAALEAELAVVRAQVQPRVDLRTAARPLLLLSATVLLAVIPSLLVFQERWLNDPSASRFFRDLWCQAAPLCRLALAPYFALIIPGFLSLIALVASQRRWAPIIPAAESATAPEKTRWPAVAAGQACVGRGLLIGATACLLLMAARIGIWHAVAGWGYALALLAWWLGWLLREVPGAQMADAWRRDREWLLAFLLVLGALVMTLSGYFNMLRFPWATALLLTLALVNLARYYRRVSPVAWVVLVAAALNGLNTNAWWYTGLGDEYGFYLGARAVAAERSLVDIGSLLFNGKGVYDAYPYLASIIQAAFLKLLGFNSFAWRYSNGFVCALAAGFFLAFFRLLLPRRTALIAGLPLAASHYIMSFGKIGFSNVQALFAMAFALWAAAWAVRSRRPLAFATLGVAQALCFYVFPAALYVLPLPLLLVLLYYPPISRPALGRWALMALSWFMVIYPLLFQAQYWAIKLTGTFLRDPKLAQNSGALLSHLATNLVYGLFSFAYTPYETHFVTESHIDPLTASLVWLGLALCLVRLVRRDRPAVFAILSFAALVFLVGASHDRPYPPVTRMFLLLPLYALFAAEGLVWLIERVERLGVVQVRPGRIVAVIAVVVIVLNLYQAYALDRDRTVSLQTWESLLLRVVQQAGQREPDSRKTCVFITDPSWTSYGIQQWPALYPMWVQFTDVIVKEPILPEPARQLIGQRDTLVVLKPDLDPAWVKTLDPALRGLNKVPCPIKATSGDIRFTLWHAPELGWLCE